MKHDKNKKPFRFHTKQYFSCLNCGKCCGIWEVPLTKAEKNKIESLSIAGFDFKNNSYFKASKKGSEIFLIKKSEKKSCVFLGEDKLCVIHKFHGEKAKPLACRIYPFDIFNWEDGVISASLRFDCPSVCSGKGNKISNMTGEIESLSREVSGERNTVTATYSRRTTANLAKIRIISEAYKNILSNEKLRPSIRIMSSAMLLNFHSKPENYPDINDAGSFFGRDSMALAERSISNLEKLISGAEEPNIHTKLIFRYVLSGYLRFDEESALKFLPVAKVSRMMSILGFSLGKGSLRKLCSDLPESSGIDPFNIIQTMKFEENSFQTYWNYLGSKLESMHFCAFPCLGFSFEHGMRHLILTFPIVSFLAAIFAKSENRSNVTSEDISKAIIYVDHTFSRSPFFALNHVRNITVKLCSEQIMPGLLKGLP